VSTRRTSTPEEVFADSPDGMAIYRRLLELVADLDVEVRATRSQVALLHHFGFAYLWVPGRDARSQVPAVLSVALPKRLTSRRFKQIVTPAKHLWMHHLELSGPDDLDDEVTVWLHDAYGAAAG
jgi:Domain of unknown function (DUF5655)